MTKFDAGEVSRLLSIVKDISTAHPQFVAISSEASARLKQINDGLAKEKADKPKDPNQVPGMPTNTPPVPSQPVEAPKSEAAKDAPIFPKDSGADVRPQQSSRARAIPSSTYDPQPDPLPADEPTGPMPGVQYEPIEPVRRV